MVIVFLSVILISAIDGEPRDAAKRLDYEAIGTLSNAINNTIQAMIGGLPSVDVVLSANEIINQAKQILQEAGTDPTLHTTGESLIQGGDLQEALALLKKEFDKLHSLAGRLIQLLDIEADDKSIVEAVIGIEITATAIIASLKELEVDTIYYLPETDEFTATAFKQ